MNWKFTALLLAVFAVLLAFAYTQRNTQPFDVGKGPPTSTPGPLMELELKDVAEVSVVADTGAYTLTKVYGGWEIDGEKAASEVKDALEELVKLESRGSVPEGAAASVYGFETPAMTVTLKTEAGTAHVLLVGDEVPGEPAFYVRLQGAAPIHMMSNAQLEQMRTWATEKPIQPTWTPTATPTTTGAAEGEGTPSTPGAAGEGTPTPSAASTSQPAQPPPVVTIPIRAPTARPTP